MEAALEDTIRIDNYFPQDGEDGEDSEVKQGEEEIGALSTVDALTGGSDSWQK